MRIDKDHNIYSRLLSLKELNRKGIEAILNNQFNEFIKIAQLFLREKAELRDDLSDLSDQGVLTSYDTSVRKLINKISKKEPFELDNIIEELNKLLKTTNEVEEDPNFYILDKAENWFHSNFDISRIYLRKIAFTPIALGIEKPKFLGDYFSEAFNCYAFGNYNAVYSLCRTILEALMITICIKRHLIKEDCRMTPPSALIDLVSTKGTLLNRNIRKLYYHRSSKVIHGKSTKKELEARELLDETVKTVINLAECHRLI
jgi:hypothetical protein